MPAVAFAKEGRPVPSGQNSFRAAPPCCPIPCRRDVVSVGADRGNVPRLHRATLGPARSSVRDSTVRCTWGAPPRPKRPKPIPRHPRTIRNLAPFTPFGRQKTRFIPKRRAIGSIPDRAISAAGKALKTPLKHPKPGLSALKVPKNRVIYPYRQSAPPRKIGDCSPARLKIERPNANSD